MLGRMRRHLSDLLRPAEEECLPKSLSVGVVVGKGGYGVVYSGTFGKKKVAIKCVSVQCGGTIQRELHALRRSNENRHPNVVEMIYMAYERDHAQIVMEYASDGELFHMVLNSGGLADEVARTYGGMMASAVCHIHSIQIVHRDIKLENWMLTDNRRRVLLVDFGLSHTFEVNESMAKHMQDCVGSLSYCPPEVLARRPYDGRSVDMWCLGVCFFAMLAGFFPFEKASYEDWRFRKYGDVDAFVVDLHADYNRACLMKPEAITTIESLLKKKPSTRLASKLLVASAWFSTSTIPNQEVCLEQETTWRSAPVKEELPKLERARPIAAALPCFASFVA